MRAHGTGSLRRQSNGKWQGRVSIPGRPRPFTFTHTNKRTVEKALYDARMKAEQGELPSDPKMKVGDWLDTWLDTSVKPNREPRTYEGYRQDIENHLRPALGRKRLMQLTTGDVQAMLNGMQGRGLSPRSLQRVRGTLRRALNVAIARDIIGRNVAALAEVPTVRPHDTAPMSADAARAILAAVRGTRLECLVLVTMALGLRQAEVLGLTWGCVDLGRGELRIEATLHQGGELRAPKTPKSRRVIPIPLEVVKTLGAHKADREVRGVVNAVELVFSSTRGTPLDGPNVTHRFQAMLRSHGLPVIRFHDLRHASASFLCALGVSLPVAMAILGHSQASTLYNVYAKANQAEMRVAMEKMGELFAT